MKAIGVPPGFLSNPYPGAINGPLWPIKIEFECYLGLLVLALMGIFRRRVLMLAIFALMLVAHAVQPYFPPNGPDRFANHLQLATFFMAGTVACLYRDRIGRTYGLLEIAVLTMVATAILEVGFVELLPLRGTYLLLYLAYEPRLLRRQVGRRVDLSYGTYLYAWPVQQLLIRMFGPWLNPWTLSLTALAGSGGLAWLSWNVVERPFLRLKRRARASSDVVLPAFQPDHQPDAVACQETAGAGPRLGPAADLDPSEPRSTYHYGDRP